MFSLKNPEVIKSSEFRKRMAEMVGRAYLRPVIVIMRGKPQAVLISNAEYEAVKAYLYTKRGDDSGKAA